MDSTRTELNKSRTQTISLPEGVSVICVSLLILALAAFGVTLLIAPLTHPDVRDALDGPSNFGLWEELRVDSTK
jgi:hypothetical protein